MSSLGSLAWTPGRCWSRRGFLAAFAGTALTGCLYDRSFDLEWRESIELHDGTVLQIRRKTRYERIGRSLTPYGGLIVDRDTEIEFSPSPGVTISQRFTGAQPLMLDRHNGTWYLLLSWAPYNNSQSVPGQDWGRDVSGVGQYGAVFDGSKFSPISLCDFPNELTRFNFLVLYGKVEEHNEFAGKEVTLGVKADWEQRHPRLPGSRVVQRPRIMTPANCLI